MPPPTTELTWDGQSPLPFTLKRKRTGDILVNTLKDKSAELSIGSELKLVGGFPVAQLTLPEVKKLMLYASKPVSLVFTTTTDVRKDIGDNSSFLTDISMTDTSDGDSPLTSPQHAHSIKQDESKARKHKGSRSKDKLLNRPVRQHAAADKAIVL